MTATRKNAEVEKANGNLMESARDPNLRTKPIRRRNHSQRKKQRPGKAMPTHPQAKESPNRKGGLGATTGGASREVDRHNKGEERQANNMQRTPTVWHWIFVLGLFASSCTDTAVLDKNVAIADNTWYYDDPPHLTAHITDTGLLYDIYLNLRHTPDYRYSNVFLLVHQSGPGMAGTTERVELRLAEPDGRWLGRSTGSIYAHQQLIKENVRFPDTGLYHFTIEQNMRENPLREIADVGIRVEPRHQEQ